MRPISRFAVEGISEVDVQSELETARREDLHFSDGHILYSMCNAPQQLAIRAHQLFLEANLGDPNLYQGTKALERSVINMLLNLLNGNSSMDGAAVSGGSEANITALWMFRNLTKKRQVVLPETAHYSFNTAGNLLGMDLRYVGVDDSFRMIPEEVKQAITADTAVVVAVAGTTSHGQIDPIDRIQKICRDNRVNLHVDAAFGGMVFPFLERAGHDLPAFDFTLDGVSSMTVDPHKMGQATSPAGVLLVRDGKWFNAIKQQTYYLSVETLHSILGTRCSAGVASAYAMMRMYGRNGFTQLLQDCMRKTEILAEGIRQLGFRLAIDPIAPVACVRFDTDRTAKNAQERLAKRGWRVSRTQQPPGIRVVMMPHIPDRVIPEFLADLSNLRSSA